MEIVKGWRRGDLCMQTRRIGTRGGRYERRGRGGRREKERKIDENRETRFSSLDLEASVGQERCTWKIEATNRNTIKKLNRNGGKETG